MGFIYGFLGVIIGLIVVLLVLFIYLFRKLRQLGLKANSIFDLKEEVESYLDDGPKQISGMTNVFLPQILKDFKEFNIDEIYLLTEKSLRTVFKAIEKKDMALINSKDKMKHPRYEDVFYIIIIVLYKCIIICYNILLWN